MDETKSPFLLNPLYSRYELGFARLDNEVLRYWAFPDINPESMKSWSWIAVAFIVLVMLFTTRADTKAESFALLFDFGVKTLVILSIGLGAWILLNRMRPKVRRIHRLYQRLRLTRTVIDGELISLEWRGYDYSYRDRMFRKYTVIDYVITARYQFVSPTTGNVITGRVQRKRRDLKRVPLPPLGTPVRVLYADDEAHMML